MCDVLACGFGLTDNYPQTGFAIAFEKMQFLQPLENPEWQVDINAVRIEDIPVEIVRQLRNTRLVDFVDPARPRWIYGG